MRALLGSLVLCCLAASASAATVRVKSGEHGPFTRLVFYLPEAVEWHMDQQDRVVTIAFPGQRYGVFLDEVFIKITRDRIADVKAVPTEESIVLRLNCDCFATTVEYSPRILVVDVAPGQSPVRRTKPAAAPFPFKDWVQAALDTVPVPDTKEPVAPAETTPEVHESDVLSGIVDAVVQKASQGYLTANDLSVAENTAPAEPIPNLTKALSSSPVLPDRNRNGPHVAEPVTPLRFNCGAAKRPGVEEHEFIAEIADLQTQLITERGEVSGDVVQRMARSFIYFGLPQEARNILFLADQSVAEMFAPAISFLDIDGWEGGQPPPRTVACEGLAEVTETVSKDGSAGLQDSPDEFVARFAALSPHLRTLLGQRIVAVLRSNAKNDYAAALDAFLGNASPVETSRSKALAQNRFPEVVLELEAAAQLPRATDGQGRDEIHSAGAGAGQNPADSTDPALMQTFVKEYDGALPEVVLAKLSINARVEEREYKAAIAEIRNAEVLSPKARRALISNVIGKTAAQGSTQSFLEVAFYLEQEEIRKMPESLLSDVRERLLSLGFRDKAEGFSLPDEGPREHAAVMTGDLN